MDFFRYLLDTSNFPRRWDCGLWTPNQGWLHIVSDLGIWSAYLAIPGVIGFFLIRKKEVPFRGVFWLFGAFILACGATHLMEAVIFWWPAYRLAGLIKLLTAVVSWATVIALVPVVPRALAMRSPGELEREAAGRRRAEESSRETGERFRQLVENIREIFWIQENGWERLLYISPAFEEAWGRTRESLYEQPHSWIDSVPAEDRALIFDHVEQQARGITTETEFRVVRPDGSVRWMRCRAFPIEHRPGEADRTAGLVEDITDRKRAEEALRESEHRWRSLTEALPQLVWTCTPDGSCDYLSTQWRGFAGVPEAELLGWRWLELVHPHDRERTLTAWQSAVEGQGGYDIEHRMRRSDGMYRWFQSRGVPIRDGAGGIIKWFGTSTDISERKRVEEALRRTTELFQAVTDGTTDGVYVKDREGRHLMFNAAASRLVGKPTGEVLGRDDTAIFDPDGARAVMAHDRRVMESGVAATEEHELTAGGVTRTYLSSKAPYRDGHGNVIGLVGICHDITDRKRAEEALRASEERFRTLAKATNDAVWDWDLSTNRVWWNEGVHTLFGYRLEEDTADPAWWLQRVHPEDREAVEAFFFEVVHGKRLTWVDEYRFRCADGSYKDVYDRGYLLRNAEGQVTRLIGAMLDITDRKRTEEALRQANARLDLAVRGSNLAIWECDMPDGRIENSHLTVINVWEPLGYDVRTSPMGFPSTFALLFHPDDQERVRRELEELFASDGEEYESEYQVRTKDGSTRWHLARGGVLRDLKGKPVRFIGTSTDITDLKRAEEALRQAEARLDLAVRGSNIAIWECNMPDGRIENSNLTYTNVWESMGYNAATAPTDFPSTFAILFHPIDQERVTSEIQELFDSDRQDYESEFRVLRTDRSSFSS